MKKILLLCLFSICTAWGLQTGTQQFIQSDSLDFAWAEEQLDVWIVKCNKKLSNIIDKKKFIINFETEVYDVMSMDTASYKDFKDIKFEEMEKNYPPKNRKRLSVQFLAHKYMKLAIIKIAAEVNIDKSIELDDDYKKAISGIINNVFYFADFKDDDIIFNSVDISKFKHNNQLSLNREDIYDDSWAVIIGIDNYQNLSNLDYAVEDAKAIKELLITKFDYSEENVKLLLNEEANKMNIVNVISDVSLKAGENDRILVFYAGHGETMPLPEGGEMGYLVPIDGNQENLFASSIPMDDLKDLSNMSKSKHMLFLIDACYGGLAAVGSRGLESAKTPNYLEKISSIKSRQIITAGGKNEKVFEKSEWGHSAYTMNLLRALKDGLADSNEDGYITAGELGLYLNEKVTIDSENQQTPQSRRLTSHEGEFIFFRDVDTKIIRSKKDKTIYGCMDKDANNYNPDAIKPDRSCNYGRLVTTLEFGEIKAISKIMGTDIKSRLQAIIPGGKTGEKYVNDYFEVPVIINNNSDIAGFQFDIFGGNVIDASGGIAEDNGFTTTHSESTVLSFSFDGKVFSRGGNQILINLKIKPIETEVCIQNIILSDKTGEKVKSTSFDCFNP